MFAVPVTVTTSIVQEIAKRGLVVANAAKNSKVLTVTRVQRGILVILTVGLASAIQMELLGIIVRQLKENVHVKKTSAVTFVRNVLLDITTSPNAIVSIIFLKFI